MLSLSRYEILLYASKHSEFCLNLENDDFTSLWAEWIAHLLQLWISFEFLRIGAQMTSFSKEAKAFMLYVRASEANFIRS